MLKLLEGEGGGTFMLTLGARAAWLFVKRACPGRSFVKGEGGFQPQIPGRGADHDPEVAWFRYPF